MKQMSEIDAGYEKIVASQYLPRGSRPADYLPESQVDGFDLADKQACRVLFEIVWVEFNNPNPDRLDARFLSQIDPIPALFRAEKPMKMTHNVLDQYFHLAVVYLQTNPLVYEYISYLCSKNIYGTGYAQKTERFLSFPAWCKAALEDWEGYCKI
jgi:hypothetical protein